MTRMLRRESYQRQPSETAAGDPPAHGFVDQNVSSRWEQQHGSAELRGNMNTETSRLQWEMTHLKRIAVRCRRVSSSQAANGAASKGDVSFVRAAATHAAAAPARYRARGFRPYASTSQTSPAAFTPPLPG